MKKQVQKFTKELLQVKSIKGSNRFTYELSVKDTTTSNIDKIIIDSRIISVSKYCKDNSIDLEKYEDMYCNDVCTRTKKLAISCYSDDLNLDLNNDIKTLMGFLTYYIKDWDNEVVEDYDNMTLRVKTITKDIDTNL